MRILRENAQFAWRMRGELHNNVKLMSARARGQRLADDAARDHPRSIEDRSGEGSTRHASRARRNVACSLRVENVRFSFKNSFSSLAAIGRCFSGVWVEVGKEVGGIFRIFVH